MPKPPEYDGPAALKGPEAHPFIREQIATLMRSFSWYRANDFGRAVDIAWYCLALGRVAEARALADELADGVPAEALHNVWAPAADVICLAARLARQANDAARHGQLIARIATTRQYVTPAERHYVEEHIAKAREDLEPHRIPGPLEQVCNDLTRSLSTAVYYTETLRAGRFRWQQWLSLDVVESIVTDGLQLLGDHLAGRIALPQRLEVEAVPEHSGLLLLEARAIPADYNALWWIDLATGDSGRVQRAKFAGQLVRIRDSSAAWLLHVRDEEGPGATLVERTPTGLVSSFVYDFDVRAISSDGRHAAMTDPRTGSLITATLDGTTLTPGAELGVTAESYETRVVAVLADGSAIIQISTVETTTVELYRVGQAPTLLATLAPFADVFVADDASVMISVVRTNPAAIDDDDGDEDVDVDEDVEEDDERTLTIHRFGSGASTSTLAIGRGEPAHVHFTRGNRHVVLSQLDTEGVARVTAIDLATATPVELLAQGASPFVVSPDGRFVIVWSMTLSIVPIEGGAGRPLAIEGVPYAWLR